MVISTGREYWVSHQELREYNENPRGGIGLVLGKTFPGMGALITKIYDANQSVDLREDRVPIHHTKTINDIIEYFFPQEEQGEMPPLLEEDEDFALLLDIVGY